MRNLVYTVLFACTLVSCYYDIEEELYPNTTCDNSNVTFSGTIEPLINSKCVSCHSGSAPSGSIALNGYDNMKAAADNGLLLETISHEPGYSPMPQNEPQLPACNIEAVSIWISDGTPNN